MKSRALIVVTAFLIAAALGPAPLLAQGEQQPPPVEAASKESRLIDSYGRLRHCDWTARLDNFAVELRNVSGAKGYVVSYNAPRKQSFAAHQLRVSRYYLVESRGLDAARFALVDGGTREDLDDGLTELWFVPEGAEPPVAPPAPDKYSQGFSGMFEKYAGDLNVYQEMAEMSMPDEDISRHEFAEKLKQQPDSVGYFVIRAPKGSAPGAWRRLARRDEQLVSGHGVEPSRLKSLDGGASEGPSAEVELWVLPVGAPPPVAGAAEVNWTLTSTVKLHTYDIYYSDESAERWMLSNLAELLRENPRASAALVAREPKPLEETDSDGAGEEAATVEPPAASAAAGDAPPDEAAEESPSMSAIAQGWKKRLASEYGIAPQRVVVIDGRAIDSNGGRVNMWVVPEKGAWPDPSALDEDELEQERRDAAAGADEARRAAPATTPR